APVADDESGISNLSAQTAIDSGSLDVEYSGVDSVLDYRATAHVGAQATRLDPIHSSQVALTRAINLDYTQAVPAVV
ncbi:DUF2957 domain-containing protein, partial [Burkholderia pseudomallei]